MQNDVTTVTVGINGYEEEKLIRTITHNFDHPRGRRMELEFEDGDTLSVKPDVGQRLAKSLYDEYADDDA